MIYVIIMIISIINMIFNIALLCSEPNSVLSRTYGEKETWILIIISVILLVIGVIKDEINDNKTR